MHPGAPSIQICKIWYLKASGFKQKVVEWSQRFDFEGSHSSKQKENNGYKWHTFNWSI